MIKRIIATLTICLIITGLFSPVFSDASALPQPNWSDPGISEIINISDLTNWMLNGGTYDVSRYTNAEDFMNDYFNARTRTRLVSPGDDIQEDYYEVLPGFGINNQLVPGESFAHPLDTNRVIASSFRDHSGYGRRFTEQANEALLNTGNLYDMKIPLLNEVEFANFVGYNHDALRLYSEFFKNNDSGPSPDPEFSFISNINNLVIKDNNNVFHDFYSSNFSNQEYGYASLSPYPLHEMSYVANDGYLTTNHTMSTSTTSNIQFTSYNPITVNLTVNDNNTCSMVCSSSNFTKFTEGVASNARRYTCSWYAGNDTIGVYVTSTQLYYPLNQNFNSLTLALNYVYGKFSNINLYVNGEPWVLISGSNPPLTPEFPDAVGGEELPTTTWPISRPRAPYYTSVPGILQAIEDAIQGDGELGIDDLKPYLTDANGDPVPDPIFDPEPVPIPVPDPVNPDIIPGLPVLPAMPPEMPGFSGVSVLAEIINFTNQSLPTSLIVTFWGIVFGIVILGLIKILHK